MQFAFPFLFQGLGDIFSWRLHLALCCEERIAEQRTGCHCWFCLEWSGLKVVADCKVFDMNSLVKNLGGCRSRWDYMSVRLRPLLPLFTAVGVEYTNALWTKVWLTNAAVSRHNGSVLPGCPDSSNSSSGCLFAWCWYIVTLELWSALKLIL